MDMVPSVLEIRSRGHTPKTRTGHMVSYFQEEAAFVDGGARWKALFPGFRVRGCWAGDVLPGRLVLTRYKRKTKNSKCVRTADEQNVP